MTQPARPKLADPFRYYNSSLKVIRAAVMLYVRFPLSLRNVEDLLFEHGIGICYETGRLTARHVLGRQITHCLRAAKPRTV
jgi:putative transposase